MTSKRNPNQRNLGPVIALTGTGIAIAAVIAGFIAVGGPGDARERRLDGLTITRISQALTMVQCAFNATGAVPATLQDAAKTRAVLVGQQTVAPICGESQPSPGRITTGDQPANPGDVTYRPTGGNGISLCGHFRRAQKPTDPQDGYYPLDTAYPELSEPRAAGIHCFNMQLIPPG